MCNVILPVNAETNRETTQMSDLIMDTDETRWEAVCRRDHEADGVFVFAVKTTGVFCRPSCPARQPKRQNVRFFTLDAEAIAAGFRPCKRCKPTDVSVQQKRVQMVEAACRYIETEGEDLSLQILADRAGLSRTHFQRTFKEVTGVTPKQYAMGKRRARVAEALRSCQSVTDAIYASGYGTSSRFYEEAAASIGMHPSQFRSGADGELIVYAFASCWLGTVTIGFSRLGVCAVRLTGSQADGLKELQAIFPKASLLRGKGDVESFAKETVVLIEEPGASVDLPLDIRGTVFQQRVWTELRKIPIGSTATYKDVAIALGLPKSSRAVARACAANPIAVLIPCHRVIRSDGQLSGYRWGVVRKQKLIELEAQSASS